MTAPSTVFDVQEMLRTRRIRLWIFSVATTAFVAAVASANLAAILIVMPSLVLATTLLLRIDEKPNWFLVGFTAVVGLLTLLWSALTEANPTGSMALAVAAGVIIEAQAVRRTAWAIVATGGIAAISTLALTTGSANAWGTIIQLTFVAAIWLITILDMGSERRLFELLERTKDVERALSVAHERERFAADLHDIQGHSLHVIKLKAAVAAKLQTADPGRTAHELKAIQQLTGETITAARELASDLHILSFEEELSSALELLDAAGVTTTVDQTRGTPAKVHDATLARVLREATTNILRHARPTQVTIVAGPEQLTITNNGATDAFDTERLTGLYTLRKRLHTYNGELRIEQLGETFTLAARLPEVDAR